GPKATDGSATLSHVPPAAVPMGKIVDFQVLPPSKVVAYPRFCAPSVFWCTPCMKATTALAGLAGLTAMEGSTVVSDSDTTLLSNGETMPDVVTVPPGSGSAPASRSRTGSGVVAPAGGAATD